MSAATDVTGFGLLGHLGNILAPARWARRSCSTRSPSWRMPATSPPAASCPAGPSGTSRRPRGSSGPTTSRPPTGCFCADAQTSGGLLLAVPPENEAALVEALRAAGTPGGGGDRPAHAGRRPDRRRVPASLATGVQPATFAPMASFRWTADRMDQLERAARDGLRVALIAPGHRVRRDRAPPHHRGPRRRSWSAACR